MAFALQNTATVGTYKEALDYYDAAKPWRGETDPGDERPFHGTRPRRVGVRMEGESVIFRYHQTDVVRWDGPDRFVLELWESISTAAFINAATPMAVRATNATQALWFGNLVYPTDARERVVCTRKDPNSSVWTPTYETRAVFQTDRVDRVAAKRAREGTNYAAYQRYYTMTKNMGFEISDVDRDDARMALTGHVYWSRYQQLNVVLDALEKGEDNFPLMYRADITPAQLREELYDKAGDVNCTDDNPGPISVAGYKLPRVGYGEITRHGG